MPPQSEPRKRLASKDRRKDRRETKNALQHWSIYIIPFILAVFLTITVLRPTLALQGMASDVLHRWTTFLLVLASQMIFLFPTGYELREGAFRHMLKTLDKRIEDALLDIVREGRSIDADEEKYLRAHQALVASTKAATPRSDPSERGTSEPR